MSGETKGGEEMSREGISNRTGRGGGVAAVLAAVAMVASPAAAGGPSVRHTLRTAPALVGLRGLAQSEPYQNAADALLERGVRQLPVHPAMGGAYTYRLDPECGCYRRVTDDLGPWFVTERAQTLGAGLLNVGLTLGGYDLTDVDGCHFGDERAPIRVSAAALDYRAGTELRYQVATLGLTYGVTDDLDVNLALPLALVDFGVNVSYSGGASGPAFGSEHFHVGPNVMDMLVRLKYRFLDRDGWAGAGGLRARLPTGDPTEGLGTGDGELGPWLALSMALPDAWLDLHWDGGFDFDVTDVQRSSAHYGFALDLQRPGTEGWSRVSLSGQLLGRSEIDGVRARTSVSGPHVVPGGIVNIPYLCLDPERQDYFDAVLGVRVRLLRSLVLSLGVFTPINRDTGVRPGGWSPVGSIEATF